MGGVPLPNLALLLLGPPRIERDGVPAQIERRKAIALIAYLAVTRQRHPRDALAVLLWPESGQARARANLRRALAALNQVLDGCGLETDWESIGLDMTDGLWLDIDQFQRRLAAYRAHGHPRTQACPDCIAPLTEAVDLYRDDFLAGFSVRGSPGFDVWQLHQAETFRSEFVRALERLVDYHSARDAFEPAIRYARRCLEVDPLREQTYRSLMDLYARSDQRTAALRQYQELLRILDRELGVPPAAETTQLYEAIRDNPITVSPRQAAPSPGADSTPIHLPSPTNGATTPQLHDETLPAGPEAQIVLRHNLPAPSTPFLGREEELAEITQRVLDQPNCRLLTLVGPGGVGKTRLALQAATEVVDTFPHGVYLVSLAPVGSVDFIMPAIAESLNFSFYSSEDPKIQLLNYLQEKEMLLVLDNFEHLIGGAGLLTEILQRAPAVQMLVTSRERLNLQGEWLFEVQGLSYPPTERANGVENYSAVQLFLQTAQRVHQGFSLTEAEKPAVIRICRLMQGLPLGIELAAPWVRMMSCADIVAEIERDLSFLTSPLQDVPDRHRSLKAVFEHSWNFLSAEEQRVLRQLSVFRGGFRREAAETVAGATLFQLLSLTNKSFLRSTHTGRYEMLEVLRRYAQGKLEERPKEKEGVEDRYCAYYAQFLEHSGAYLRGDRQKEVLAEIRAEIENVRAYWDLVLAKRKVEEIGRSLDSLYHFYETRGWFQQGEQAFRVAVERMREGLATANGLEPACGELLGRLIARQGGFAHRLGLYQTADELLQESLTFFHRPGTEGDVAFILNSLGDVRRIQGEYAEARQLLQQSVNLCKTTGDQRRMARALNNLGIVAGSLGESGDAKARFEEALRIFREIGDQWGITKGLNNLGILAYYAGDYAEAKQLYEESLAVRIDIGDPYGKGVTLNNLGLVAHEMSNYTQAKQLHLQSIAIFKEIGYQLGLGLSFKDLGNAACALKEYQAAEKYFHEALRIAMATRTIPLVLYAFLGLARLFSDVGEQERAIELLVPILSHAATDEDTRDRAERLLTQLQSQLPRDLMAAARQNGETRDLEKVAQELLNR